MWRLRAMAEYRASERTWFGTLTYRPEVQYQAKLHAAHRLGTYWQNASEADFFRLHDSALHEHVKRYFKRLRKNSGKNIRYLLVTEAHKSGDPHHHLLVHSTANLTWRNVTDPWVEHDIGHCKFVLADDKSAIYVCKYLTKSILSRIRSSNDYGNNQLVNSEETGPIKRPRL